MNNSQNHAVIILAGGLSQRLGQAKQLLCKDGEPLLRYMTKLALTTQPQAIVVVIPDDNLAIANATDGLVAQHSMIHTAVNRAPETGMAHSLYLGIEALSPCVINADVDSQPIKRVLIMSVDQVLLSSDHLLQLLAGNRAVVASSYHRGETLDETLTTETSKAVVVGVPLVIDYDLLKEWQSALVGDKGLRHLIRGLFSHQMSTVINHQLSYDIDTPHQLAQARQKGWLDG